MDLLCTAVVDITTLSATHRALSRGPLDSKPRVRRKLRDRLQTELRRGIEAYIVTLARSKRGVLDDRRLALCRVTAEVHMTLALAHEPALRQLMTTASGALLGVTAVRQDLWRLAHMAIHLRQGIAALQATGADPDWDVKKSGARLRRALAQSLIAYARGCQRDGDNEDQMVVRARKATLQAIATHECTSLAAGLGLAEAGAGATHDFIRLGVARSLSDLVLDWSPRIPAQQQAFETDVQRETQVPA